MDEHELHEVHTRSAVAVHALLMYCPDGQAPEHETHDPGCPLPQPETYFPEGHDTELGQLMHTRFAVLVHPDTSYCVALQAVQGTATTTV